MQRPDIDQYWRVIFIRMRLGYGNFSASLLLCFSKTDIMRFKHLFFLFPALIWMVLSVCPVMAQQGKLTINIKGIEPAKGSVRVALYNTEADFPDPQRVFTAQILPLQTKAETLQVTFEDLSHGAYAAAVYQDVNKNGTLDENAMGIPTEPYGFSNNPRVKWSSPKFESAVFQLKDKPLVLDIAIKRWKAW